MLAEADIGTSSGSANGARPLVDEAVPDEALLFFSPVDTAKSYTQ